jgi:hypothetical protein
MTRDRPTSQRRHWLHGRLPRFHRKRAAACEDALEFREEAIPNDPSASSSLLRCRGAHHLRSGDAGSLPAKQLIPDLVPRPGPLRVAVIRFEQTGQPITQFLRDGNRLRYLGETVPDRLEQLEPLGGRKAQDLGVGQGSIPAVVADRRNRSNSLPVASYPCGLSAGEGLGCDCVYDEKRERCTRCRRGTPAMASVLLPLITGVVSECVDSRSSSSPRC